jgi:dUTP pyrophosphatase
MSMSSEGLEPKRQKVDMSSPYLQVKLLSDTAKAPTRGSAHAAGYDLYASVAVTIAAGDRALVPLGISVAVPEDCYARIAPRSGLAVKAGISTGAGVVDCDYRGEVRVLLFNHGKEAFEVKAGDRIAQMILERVYTPEVQVVDSLVETVRGAGGFGSTGQ